MRRNDSSRHFFHNLGLFHMSIALVLFVIFPLVVIFTNGFAPDSCRGYCDRTKDRRLEARSHGRCRRYQKREGRSCLWSATSPKYEEEQTAQRNRLGAAVPPRLNARATYSWNQHRNTPPPKSRYPYDDTAKRQNKPPRMTKSPDQVEEELSRALEALKVAVAVAAAVKQNSHELRVAATESKSIQLLLFPTARECNAALAAIGDARDLLRALKVFGKMRKAATLQRTLQLQVLSRSGGASSSVAGTSWPVPTPTLVTYSTLMSRFVKANKPAVALRLWNLMIRQGQQSPAILDIDVKAANILMNCYAKLADVDAAQHLLDAMKQENQTRTVKAESRGGVHLPPPNSITYNTFLSACHKAGDLDAAVAAVYDMVNNQKLKADALTYTSLIATVARRASKAAGRNDPTPAFQFLEDMRNQGIQPNGMTYSALIDACGRCRRSDLALQGLRIMLLQKTQEEKELIAAGASNLRNNSDGKTFTLPSEVGAVGAWTSAINACGKAGRVETAVRLFYAMSNFGVQPNTVTCGSLTDSLLRAGRTAETLDVLRYMKRAGIRPSEVMYTSLMSRAEKLVEMERQSQRQHREQDRFLHPVEREIAVVSHEEAGANTKAIEVYTELIDSLINTEGDAPGRDDRGKSSFSEVQASKSLLLLKVFLVFQEMKTAGAEVDLPCYNTLLRACAQAGDTSRAQDVLRKMQRDNLDPNDTSWRLLLRSASSAATDDGSHLNRKNTVEMAESIWKQGLSHRQSRRRIDDPVSKRWMPSVDSFLTLISVYMREAEAAAVGPDSVERKQYFYRRVLKLYEDVLMGRDELGMNRIDLNRLLESQKAMLVILQAIVNLEEMLGADTEERFDLRSMAASILKLDCFVDNKGNNVLTKTRIGPSARQALRIGRSWAS